MGDSERERRRTSKNLAVPPDDIVFGVSSTLQLLKRRANKVAPASVPVLIEGEAGTGKEILARWIHTNSRSSRGSFVKVSCAAIPSPLFECELFGFEKGAFTGATQTKPGRIEAASEGTLFLDDISELDPRVQSKLLHFLQDGVFSRVGDQVERRIDTRVICSSSRDLESDVESGKFRADLYYRVSVVKLCMPPLRERRDDIPRMAEYLRMQHESKLEKKTPPFRPEIWERVSNLAWPGNLRELSNEVARYVLMGPESLLGGQIVVSGPKVDLNPSCSVPQRNLKHIASDAVRELEKRVILETLRQNRWNRRKAAQVLRISYRSLIYKIREAGLNDRSCQT